MKIDGQKDRVKAVFFLCCLSLEPIIKGYRVTYSVVVLKVHGCIGYIGYIGIGGISIGYIGIGGISVNIDSCISLDTGSGISKGMGGISIGI